MFTGTFDSPNFAAVNPDLKKDLLMSPGDRIRIHLHDASAGLRADLADLTTGTSGSMTASTANGFGHVLYRPNANNCKAKPYAFHPEYSTGMPRGNTWSAHTYNIAMSDEIGHFENCQGIDPGSGNCKTPGAQDSALDGDDVGCVPAADSTLVAIDGCFAPDGDFDGQSYQLDWPGTNPNPAVDSQLHPTPVMFTSATTDNGTRDYSTVAFETDLPRIEAADSQLNPPFCERSTGVGCVNPPVGAKFYPFYSTTMNAGTCTWQEGGDFIPGTTNDFGGSSTTEYGPLLLTAFPTVGPAIEHLYDNFNSGNLLNPCPVFRSG